MAVRRVQSDMDVVTAAKKRIKNVFSNGVPVYMSFSGGKDSLCVAQLVYSLIQSGEIDPSQLTAIFIDEEAIFPCIEETVRAWRKKLMLAGAKFIWYCLEVRHFSCFNQLTADESFICWDSRKSDVWVRQPPPFAVRSHPMLKPRVDNYQSFLPRATKDGIMLSGVRAAESVQRLQYMAALNMGAKGITGNRQIYPIYDWKTSDVWLFLKEEHVEIPSIYLYMWQAGISKGQLRVSQFFSSDTAACLVRMNEYYPDLMERVIRREPNAYLAALYWDSEMFGRTTHNRKALEENKNRDYKAELIDMLIKNPGKHFHTEHQKHVAEQYRKALIKIEGMARPRDYRKLYDGLLAGDPKIRTLRAVYQDVFCHYAENTKRTTTRGGAVHG
ncbi:MAG: phosphoadenosine phosphosulfate reductase family protein [Clostridia bacterium]|nr:phosphoadenosine phosphosulfate reductase family protein [Clostridia bacterium]MBR0302532.1 phosphoadenosine phosphosulfate reductase family protein [Clostridia bacterium]